MLSGDETQLQVNGLSCSRKYLRKRCYGYFDSDYFIDRVQQIRWLDIYLTNDVNEALNLFYEKVRPILDDMAPIRTIQIRNNYAPWLSQETIQLMKSRNELLKLATETKSKEDWNRYKSIRNKVTNKQKCEEFYWQRARLDNCGQHSGSPSQPYVKEKLLSRAQDIANAQNEYSFFLPLSKLVLFSHLL